MLVPRGAFFRFLQFTRENPQITPEEIPNHDNEISHRDVEYILKFYSFYKRCYGEPPEPDVMYVCTIKPKDIYYMGTTTVAGTKRPLDDTDTVGGSSSVSVPAEEWISKQPRTVLGDLLEEIKERYGEKPLELVPEAADVTDEMRARVWEKLYKEGHVVIPVMKNAGELCEVVEGEIREAFEQMNPELLKTVFKVNGGAGCGIVKPYGFGHLPIFHVIRLIISKYLGDLLYPDMEVVSSIDAPFVDMPRGTPKVSSLKPHVDISPPSERNPDGSASWSLNRRLEGLPDGCCFPKTVQASLSINFGSRSFSAGPTVSEDKIAKNKKGFTPMNGTCARVDVPAGSIVLWLSNTLHANHVDTDKLKQEIEAGVDFGRIALPVSVAPEKFCSEGTKYAKFKSAMEGKASTHGAAVYEPDGGRSHMSNAEFKKEKDSKGNRIRNPGYIKPLDPPARGSLVEKIIKQLLGIN